MAAEERVKREDIEISLGGENPNIDIERSSVSCTSSSSATISDFKWESYRMVKSELDAARALADFAELALLERENPSGESSRKWGHKGRRSKKRVKNETTVGDWGKNLDSSKVKSFSDIVQQEHSIETQPWDEKLSNVEVKALKAEQDSKLPTANHSGARNCASFSGRRSKQHLSEAEKEARRLRRVLANRESARQTIRRRQAIFEELTKKAAELALDNESMKREKEVVMKEYQSLKDTNKQLKAQMAKTETEETPSTMVKTPASSSGNLLLPEYGRPPFTPFSWPSVMQPPNPVQKQPVAHTTSESCPKTTHCSQDEEPSTGKTNPFHEHSNPSSANGPKPPFYIFPCPWFFPLPDHGNQLLPHPLDSCGLGDKNYDKFVSKLHDTGLSLKPMGNVERHQSFICRKVKTDPSSSTEASSTNNFPESSVRSPINGGGHPEGWVLMPVPLGSVKAESTVKPEMELLQYSNSRTESISTAGSHVSGAFPETMQEVRTYANKKLADAAAAAEARKRRKGLTKLKSHHSRQLRFRC